MSWIANESKNWSIFDHGWQYPAKTEQHAADMIRQKNIDLPYQYVGFPWATLIDYENRARKNEVEEWLEKLDSIPKLRDGRRVTVAQHISVFKRIPFFKRVGITDIFWSHATSDAYLIDGVRIHAFPLYPVQVPTISRGDVFKTLSDKREYLYSFVGTYTPKGYISEIRKCILEEFKHDQAKIIFRQEWHYEKLVYQKQIDNKVISEDVQSTYEKNSDEYRDILAKSNFSLCPSGSGPNSIRLWESLGAFSIPVIFSSNLRLPGDQELWNKAALIYPDNISSVSEVITAMEKISENPETLRNMRLAGQDLWLRYGSQNFIHDLLKLAGDRHG